MSKLAETVLIEFEQRREELAKHMDGVITFCTHVDIPWTFNGIINTAVWNQIEKKFVKITYREYVDGIDEYGTQNTETREIEL